MLLKNVFISQVNRVNRFLKNKIEIIRPALHKTLSFFFLTNVKGNLKQIKNNNQKTNFPG